ncbi:MAG: hypothetical protein RIT36_713 [Bacteroidota bacterium]
MIRYPTQTNPIPNHPITILMKLLSFIVLFAALIASSTAKAAPSLNSFPTASATILLDFDGHDVSSSMWNYGTPFSCMPAAMTDVQITEAFNRVAEDFRPFNINVTTDLAKFLAAPLSQRVRIIITPTSAWYAGVAGIAYVTSFTWGDDTPAFVFSDRLVNDPKRVAEAISHETGHTLGLYHQAAYDANCTLTSSYSTGVGSGVTSWGPIMGNVASKNVTQWNYGATPNGCTYLQDNLSVITTTNGFGYRTDDVANVYSSATAITVAANAFSKDGIISTTADVDFFKFSFASTGNFKMNAIPYNVGADLSGANLDLKITLYNAKGIIIKTYDIVDSLHIRIDTTLNAGNYFFQIDGAGSISNANDYGSLGAYTISGTFSGTTTATATTTTKTTGRKTAANPGINSASEETPAIRFKVIKQAQQPVIVSATESYDYMVVDNFGRIILNGKAAAGTKTIDIRNQPAGIYNLRLMNANEQRTEKFMNR